MNSISFETASCNLQLFCFESVIQSLYQTLQVMISAKEALLRDIVLNLGFKTFQNSHGSLRGGAIHECPLVLTDVGSVI